MKQIGRARRHKRVLKKMQGTKEQPRLIVFRSKKHIYAQLIDDTKHCVVFGCSTLGKDFLSRQQSDKDKDKLKASNKTGAKMLGALIAEKALELGLKKICFDRGGYKYHGRIKCLADSAREGGLQF